MTSLLILHLLFYPNRIVITVCVGQDGIEIVYVYIAFSPLYNLNIMFCSLLFVC